MGLIKEPKNVDFSMKSKPWKEEELKELSAFIKRGKATKTNSIKKDLSELNTSEATHLDGEFNNYKTDFPKL